jgi:hypothetical protein
MLYSTVSFVGTLFVIVSNPVPLYLPECWRLVELTLCFVRVMVNLQAQLYVTKNTVDDQLFLRLHRESHRECQNRDKTHTLAVT